MMAFFDGVFGTGAFLPHGQCLSWDGPLVALHATSEVLIALAYFAIPIAITVFVRRRGDLEPAQIRVAALFCAFILACGVSHMMGAVTLWVPLYWAEGFVKAGTAAISLGTAFVLFPLIPKLLALPNPNALRAANEHLRAEVANRELLVAELREVRADLEARVAQRTRALARVMENFETTLKGSAVTVFQQDPDLRYTWIHNPQSSLSVDEFIGKSDSEVFSRDVSAVTVPFKQAILDSGVGDRVEVSVERAPGEDPLWYDLRTEPLRDDDGTIIGLSSVAVDITDRKEGEAQTRILMRELTHRSKNLLAVVQGIARQTAATADNMEDFTVSLAARLQSLGESHDLLVSSDWRGASLPDLLRAQVGYFLSGDDHRLDLLGPDLVLTAEATQQVGLALHELSTNAAKYGALSVSGGKVGISWETRMRDDGKGVELELRWRERGGPPVSPPRRKGFGHTMVTYLVPRALHGTAELDHAPDGLRWTLVFPLFARAADPGDDPILM
ncbi:MAG: PAS domain-containing protein [Rhodospirillum sp.]|nr:PAS domain-containing protein [Rhodospirillum sp.]MCF8490872.1 PAS domain-containing protein [Rhodospirillum sp.]MCF8500108.1 PAS domain-containing protein [Rhodospirillum sp.]